MWIISSDAIFASALQVALHQIGLYAEISPDLPPRKAESAGYVIDLDSIHRDVPLPSPSITISRSPHKGADLCRPFLFTDFTALASERFIQPARALSTETAVPAPSSEQSVTLLADSLILFGKKISLSPSERAIMAMLLDAKGECVPTAEIDGLWQESGGNTTAVYISYLRKKIQSVTDLNLIRSVRGKGYCLCLPR